MKISFERYFIHGFIMLSFIFLGCTSEKKEQVIEADEEVIELSGKWYSLEEAQKLAAKEGKKVLVYAEASWCPYCKQMKREVFPQEGVLQVTEEYFYPVKVDIESEDILTYDDKQMTEAQFSDNMKINFTPTFIFFASNGEMIAKQPGYFLADQYIEILQFIGMDAYLNQSFDNFMSENQ